MRMWALAIARALESEGVDARAALGAAGLVPPDNPDADARCPVAAMTRVWQAAAESSGDPAIGLRVAAHVQPASMHALGLTLLVSGTLDEMIRRMERYSRIVTEALVIRIRRQSDRVTVSYDAALHDVPLAHEAFDAFLGLSVKLGRMLGGPNVHPLKVELMRPQPRDVGPYLEWFRAPVAFGADGNRLHYNPTVLDRPLPTAHPGLARANEQLLVDYLSHLDRRRVSQRVRSEIIDRLGSGCPRLVDIARGLNMSARGLQRRLHAEGTSYKSILDATRRELAVQYLRQPSLSLSDITYMLGFDDQSNFTRAFRRWIGTTPQRYRAQAPGPRAQTLHVRAVG